MKCSCHGKHIQKVYFLSEKVTEEFGKSHGRIWKKSRKNLEKVSEEWKMQSEGPPIYSVFFEENHKKYPQNSLSKWVLVLAFS